MNIKMSRKIRFTLVAVSDLLMILILLINTYQGNLFSIVNIFPVAIIALNFYTIYYFTKK